MQTIKMSYKPEKKDGNEIEISTEMIVDPNDAESIAAAGDTAAHIMLIFFRAFFTANLVDPDDASN